MTAPSLSSMSPPTEVSPPAFTPYPYGLLSAAEVIDGDGRWELGGVAYTTPNCPNRTSEWVTRCPVDTPVDPVPEKSMPTGLDEVSGKPFMLYDAVVCYPQSGRTETELRDMAAESLLAGEQEDIERKLWDEIRTDAEIIEPPNGAQSWHYHAGVGALEYRLAQLYGGIGVIHAPRFMLALSHDVAEYSPDRTQRLDPGNNPWAFGSGYDLRGPVVMPPDIGNPENIAPPGTAWIYATGPVVVRRSEMRKLTAFDHHTNERRALAERSYVITVGCPTLAVLVKIPEK